jgi:hypothetical protein
VDVVIIRDEKVAQSVDASSPQCLTLQVKVTQEGRGETLHQILLNATCAAYKHIHLDDIYTCTRW